MAAYLNASTNVTTPFHVPDDMRRLYKIAGSIQCVIAVIGIIFNVLNIYVLVKLVNRRHGVSPTYHLLIAMGVADLMVLFFNTFFLLNAYVARKDVLLFYDLTDEHHSFYHVLHYIWVFFLNPFSLSSNWLVVATTFFRYLAVAFPMKVCQW